MANDMGFDLSGLDQFDLEGLGKRGAPVGNTPNGKPLVIPTSELYEDPNQPRTENNPGFSIQSIEEMGISITTNGIKMPIIVRSKDDRGYKICDGARRYRGAKIKNIEFVPVIIDDNFSRAQQLMVNLQREGNTVDEIVQLIWELENDEKLSRTEIAAQVGKSKAFVTEHAKFGAINPLIRALYENGECGDVTLCNKLDDLFKEFPDQVRSFVTSGRSINRPSVQELAKTLRTPLIEESDNKAPAGVANGSDGQHGLPGVNGGAANDAVAQAPAPAAAAPAAAPAPESKAEAPAAAPSSKNTPEAPAPAPESKEGKEGNEITPKAPVVASAPESKPEAPAAAPEVYAFGNVSGRAVFLLMTKLAEGGMCWVADEIDGTELLVKCSNFKLERVEAR